MGRLLSRIALYSSVPAPLDHPQRSTESAYNAAQLTWAADVVVRE